MMWKHGIFDCIQSTGFANSYIMASCPPLLFLKYAITMSKHKFIDSKWYSLQSIKALLWARAQIRQKIRQRYHIDGNEVNDMIAHVFCFPCAMMQEISEVELQVGVHVQTKKPKLHTKETIANKLIKPTAILQANTLATEQLLKPYLQLCSLMIELSNLCFHQTKKNEDFHDYELIRQIQVLIEEHNFPIQNNLHVSFLNEQSNKFGVHIQFKNKTLLSKDADDIQNKEFIDYYKVLENEFLSIFDMIDQVNQEMTKFSIKMNAFNKKLSSFPELEKEEHKEEIQKKFIKLSVSDFQTKDFSSTHFRIFNNELQDKKMNKTSDIGIQFPRGRGKGKGKSKVCKKPKAAKMTKKHSMEFFLFCQSVFVIIVFLFPIIAILQNIIC